MEQLQSNPVEWVGKEYLGFVVNAAFSEENTQKIMTWLEGLNEAAPEGVYTMKPEGLHITVLDWVAPLFDYDGRDKKSLYNELYPSYDRAFRQITEALPPFDIHFTELRVTPSAIILVGHDQGQFQTLRQQLMNNVTLPKGGKQPPTIVHSSLARFVPPKIELTPISEYAADHPLDIVQHMDAFRLVETRREPMQDFSVLDTYQLNSSANQ
jgi:hypothetical protein